MNSLGWFIIGIVAGVFGSYPLLWLFGANILKSCLS